MTNSNQEKTSAFKTAFQWAAAVAALPCSEAPQRAFEQAGQAWDYVKTWAGSKKAPQAT